MTFHLRHEYKKLLSDVVTPVGLFLRMRQDNTPSVLLESGEYRGATELFSYLATGEIASFQVQDSCVTEVYPDGSTVITEITSPKVVSERLEAFRGAFIIQEGAPKIIRQGLFGFICYDAIQFFEKIKLSQTLEPSRAIPLIRYSVFSHLIAINHFRNELYLIRSSVIGHEARSSYPYDSLDGFAEAMFQRAPPATASSFKKVGTELSNFTDEEYLEVVRSVQNHIQQGDIFQIVPSRRFSQCFQGDDFNVYRMLRSINPSPYLFYFDYGQYKLFGSSPEAELIITESREASLFPIAGTFPRGESEEEDQQRAKALLADEKEAAEHVMLVDLARNDLSKHCSNVKVERFKEVQFYSHVIHLVSKVVGRLKAGTSPLTVLMDTFPAGTLSGAPKHRAMQLIDQYERGGRAFYGGCLGFLGFNCECNHAIMIRTFLSKENVLYSQAGGGVVARSIVEREGEEVRNKLKALNKAVSLAEEVGR
jgi:anthranilate synthase component 1